MLYFDNQTAAPPTKEVVAAMMPYLAQHFVSPLSPHKMSTQLFAPMKEALDTLYRFVGADPEDHFVLTSSGSEAINHVVFSTYMEQARRLGKNHFLTSIVEEAPMIKAMSRLKEMACLFEMVPVNRAGIVAVEALEEMITPRTALFSLSWANGLTGVIQPIAALAALCKQRGILLHVDATHILGKGSYRFSELGADFLTFNGEQLHGPKGSGGLFIRKGVEIAPLIVGDKEQQELRAGSYPMALLMGLSKAAEQMASQQDHYAIEIASLRGYFENRLKEVSRNPFAHSPRIPNVSNLIFPHIASDSLAYYLAEEKLYACMGGNHFQKMSHLFQASQIEKEFLHSGLSFAFGRDHSKKDIDLAVAKILECVMRLKKMEVTFV